MRFNLIVSVREILEQQGIRYFTPINGLLTNWVEQMKLAEARGRDCTPVRIGVKRVFLSSSQELPARSRIWLKIITPIAIATFSILSFGIPKPSHQKTAKPAQVHCVQLSSDDQLVEIADKYSLRDWQVSLVKISQIGQLAQFSYTAQCRGETSSGKLLGIVKGDLVQIKKMAPTLQ
jgi:hypothetical protein